MTTRRSKTTAEGEPDPPIVHHYILVPIAETMIILVLAWLASHFH